jgi:hypothetical protein
VIAAVVGTNINLPSHPTQQNLAGACTLEHNTEFKQKMMDLVHKKDRPINLSLKDQVLVVASTANVHPDRCIAVNCRQGFYDPAARTQGRHIGMHPHILETFVCSANFSGWLHRFLEVFLVTTERDRLRESVPSSRSFCHIGCWCNQGPAFGSTNAIQYRNACTILVN